MDEVQIHVDEVLVYMDVVQIHMEFLGKIKVPLQNYSKMEIVKNIHYLYPFFIFNGIKGMKGNTMTLSPGNIVRLSRPAKTSVQGNPAETIDKELFLELLAPIKKHLYNFIKKSLNFSHDADDIFQETLLKSFRYFHSFQQDKSFKTWIFTIAHNLVKDYFSSPGSLAPLEDADAVVLDEDQSLPLDVKEIYHVAANLKPRHREVFFLYYYNEFKVMEIVEITGLTKVNVKFILHQARKTVRNILEVNK